MVEQRELSSAKASPEAVEPPGESRRKGAKDENFPVASMLIAPALRPHIRTFYAFARAADDIADAPHLDAGQKRARLDALSDALSRPVAPDSDGDLDSAPARALAVSLAETGIGPGYAQDLLAAFRQDTAKNRYENWGELMDYCRLSAAPCGRYLLALHGETGETVGTAAYALSAGLQVINHIQDCRDDYRSLDRVYVPQDWLRAGGAVPGDLDAEAVSPALRRVFDLMLARVDRLIADAAPLPSRIGNRRLALEAAVVIEMARKLSHRLKFEDPLARRVALTRMQMAGCVMAGLLRGARWRLGAGS